MYLSTGLRYLTPVPCFTHVIVSFYGSVHNGRIHKLTKIYKTPWVIPFTDIVKHTRISLSMYLISVLVPVIDAFHRDLAGSHEVCQLSQVHSVTETFLQFCCRRQLFVDACLDPSATKYIFIKPSSHIHRRCLKLSRIATNIQSLLWMITITMDHSATVNHDHL